MQVIRTDIPEVLIIEPARFGDERGWFMETHNQPRFEQALLALGLPLPGPFVQDNHSCSQRGVLRGMHLQLAPFAQGKLVRVAQGSAYDVAVDVRPGSPTYGRWVGVELSAANARQMWVPPGFAHGFLSLEDNTHFLYKVTALYDKASERSIRWDDPALAITWPLDALDGLTPLVAAKDADAPTLAQAKLA